MTAKLTLVHHLEQLKNLGYADIEAIDLVALGSGYVSLEKAPELIKLGVIQQE